ncbi:FUSC family protein [Vibrio sp. SCSIO 43135]|uniref:FUSC family protein n=1 Tax=Vibrio sp. SCSIO 43135 TaxID=2819096 RepID=UPI0020763FAC|nr:FUSC family protein [Vibrio sp. SCSIO 43135]USD43339.1 FUSC family protein [Vibrio sp. SCSIO 43135]
MLSHSSKEAIKTGVALSLTLMAVHWLGWQKTSWAMLTVFVLSLTDVYGYSALKSQNRALGTLLGSLTAFVILSLFSQDRVGFFVSVLGFLSFCVYMSFDARRGYLYNIAITVCLVITSAGIDSGTTGFATAILRLQETLLGVVIFSLVYRMLWPVTTESEFERVASLTLDNLHQRLLGDQAELEPEQVAKNIQLLNDLLSLPSNAKSGLAARKEDLTIALNALNYLHAQTEIRAGNTRKVNDEKLLDLVSDVRAILANEGDEPLMRLRALPLVPITSNKGDDLPNRIRCIALVLSMAITMVFMWIWMPVPGGALFPVLGLIIALNLAKAPAKFITPVMLLYFLFAFVVLAQYVLVFPMFTESWQIALVFS